MKTLCHRKRWPRSSFLSQERPWPQTFCKIRPILAKNLYFSAYFPLFLLFSWRRILANHFNFLDFFGYEWKKKEGFGREISLPKVASSSLKMQRKCRKEKDKKFCLDETKRKMARYSISPKMNFWGNTNIHNPRKKVIHQRKCLFYELRHRPFPQFLWFLGTWNAKNQFLAKFLGKGENYETKEFQRW